MSATSTVEAVVFPFSRRPYKGYPIGWWQSYSSPTGDATGGNVSATHRLEGSGKLTSRLWTVEGVLAHRYDVVADTVAVSLLGFSQTMGSGNPQAVGTAALVVTAATVGVGALPTTFRPPLVGLLLAHRPGVALECVVQWGVNTDTIIYHSVAWGWVWDVESFEGPAGIVRPWAANS